MPISYHEADDIQALANDLIQSLSLEHIEPARVICFRSKGSRSRNALARCYSLSKIWQQGLHLPSFYIIEVISERYDRLSEEDKIKVIIHELMHIPICFGGGLRPHKGCVTRKAVEDKYRRFISVKRINK